MNDALSIEYIQYTWDQIAISFDKTRRHPWKQCINFLKTLSRKDIVGDFGCGNGRHTLEIAGHCKKVIAIDLSKKLLNILKQKINSFHTIEIIHADLINIPLKENCLDSVFYIASLHNIPKKKQRLQSLKELYRVLKPGGYLYLSEWNRTSWQCIAFTGLCCFAFKEKDYWEKLLKENNFKDITYENIMGFGIFTARK